MGAPPRAEAQVSYEGCRAGGVPVASIANSSINDVAYAMVDNYGRPIILYNPYVLQIASQPTRMFFYYHECGHHVLGHTIGRGHAMSREQEADCWAIRELVRNGFGRSQVNAIQRDIAAFGRGDWTHVPGPQRAINLDRCL
jgi:hypothetical protein